MSGRNGVLKTEQVRSYISELVQQLGKSGRLPSEHELCRVCQVSRGTIGKVIGELVAEGFLFRIQGKGTFVAEHAAQAHAAPRPRQQGRVLIVYRHEASGWHPYYSERLRGIGERLGEAGLAMEMIRVGEDVVQPLASRGAAPDVLGVISFHVADAWLPRLRERFAKPIVTTYSPGESVAAGAAVVLECRVAMRQLARRLAEDGHRDLLLITAHDDIAAFFSTVMPSGTRICLAHAGQTAERGYQAMERYYDPSITAVYVDDDVVARGVVRYILENGISVPGDLSLAAKINKGVELMAPGRVSAIEIDAYKLGTLAAATLLEMLAGDMRAGNSVTVESPFIDNGSLGPANRARVTIGGVA